MNSFEDTVDIYQVDEYWYCEDKNGKFKVKADSKGVAHEEGYAYYVRFYE